MGCGLWVVGCGLWVVGWVLINVDMYVHTLACVITVAGPTKVSLLRRHVTRIYEQ